MTHRATFFAVVTMSLAACGPGTGTGATSPSPTPTPSGIKGTVMLGPTCPVERIGGPPCSRPLATTVDIDAGDGTVLVKVQSGADGTFTASVAPGTYQVVAERSPGGAGMYGKAETVTVAAGAFTVVNVTLDTGIR